MSYGDGLTGYFIYARLLKGLKVGGTVARGKPFATTELCDGGLPHIHIFLTDSGLSVDPYDYFTVSHSPQYPE